MGVEIKSERSIKRYLFWGCLVVMVAYLWTTFSTMLVVPVGKNNATYGVVQTVQIALRSHARLVGSLHSRAHLRVRHRRL